MKVQADYLGLGGTSVLVEQADELSVLRDEYRGLPTKHQKKLLEDHPNAIHRLAASVSFQPLKDFLKLLAKRSAVMEIHRTKFVPPAVLLTFSDADGKALSLTAHAEEADLPANCPAVLGEVALVTGGVFEQFMVSGSLMHPSDFAPVPELPGYDPDSWNVPVLLESTAFYERNGDYLCYHPSGLTYWIGCESFCDEPGTPFIQLEDALAQIFDAFVSDNPISP